MKHLMRKMLRFEQNERMSFEELFEHDFFKEELEKNLQNIKNKQHEIPIKKTIKFDSLFNDEEFKEDSPSYEKSICCSDFYDHLNFLDKQSNPDHGKKLEKQSNFDNVIRNSISLELKKIKNQIFFLDYFEEFFLCGDFSEFQLGDLNLLRLMIQKLRIAIIMKTLNETENHSKLKKPNLTI